MKRQTAQNVPGKNGFGQALPWGVLFSFSRHGFRLYLFKRWGWIQLDGTGRRSLFGTKSNRSFYRIQSFQKTKAGIAGRD